MSSRMAKLLMGSASISLIAACAMETDVEKVDVSRAAVTVEGPQFAGTPGLFLIFTQANTGNTQHVSRYQTQTNLAHFQYIKAAANYQIRQEPTAKLVEEVFLNSETWEESDGPPTLTWAEAGKVLANTATYDYRLFDADGLQCVGVTRGVRPASADNSLDAYKNMLSGYFCDGSQTALTAADAETLIKSLRIKR